MCSMNKIITYSTYWNEFELKTERVYAFDFSFSLSAEKKMEWGNERWRERIKAFPINFILIRVTLILIALIHSQHIRMTKWKFFRLLCERKCQTKKSKIWKMYFKVVACCMEMISNCPSFLGKSVNQSTLIRENGLLLLCYPISMIEIFIFSTAFRLYFCLYFQFNSLAAASFPFCSQQLHITFYPVSPK